MGRVDRLVALVCLWLLPFASAWGAAKVIVPPKDTVRLVAVGGTKRVTVADISQRYPDALAILTGPFFDPKSFAISGLRVEQGRLLARQAQRKLPNGTFHVVRNRMAIGWAGKGQLTLALAANLERTWRKRQLTTVYQIGPPLILNGQDWNDWDIADRAFLRDTQRQALGLTTDGELFWAFGKGTLESFRAEVASQLKGKIAILALLDGGSSASLTKAIPTRFIILPQKPPPSPRWIERVADYFHP